MGSIIPEWDEAGLMKHLKDLKMILILSFELSNEDQLSEKEIKDGAECILELINETSNLKIICSYDCEQDINFTEQRQEFQYVQIGAMDSGDAM